MGGGAVETFALPSFSAPSNVICRDDLMSTVDNPLSEEVAKMASEAKDHLDEHTLKTVHWHFSDETGSPFWLEKKTRVEF